jgi:hypothetical protein
MKKGIHNYQLRILRVAAEDPSGILYWDRSACQALVKRGFASWNGVTAYITDAGRERAKLKADYCIKRDGQPVDPSMMEDLPTTDKAGLP